MSVYLGDKSHRITLRLNDNQFSFVKDGADAMDVSPSDFLRMTINVAMTNQKNLKESMRRENEQTDIDNKL